MIDILCAEPAKRRIAVLGEMLELGHMAEQLHRELGAYAARAGVDVLIGVRGAAEWLVEEAHECGLADYAAFFFPGSERAGEFLRGFARPGDAILFKGSRGIHLERALAALTQDKQDETKI
jgi:UDP-N-acetylmuramoyl-tripeptide--D-alanyl-D-alanine ligase